MSNEDEYDVRLGNEICNMTLKLKIEGGNQVQLHIPPLGSREL